MAGVSSPFVQAVGYKPVEDYHLIHFVSPEGTAQLHSDDPATGAGHPAAGAGDESAKPADTN